MSTARLPPEEHYSFDLKKEAEAIFANFPHLRENTIFFTHDQKDSKGHAFKIYDEDLFLHKERVESESTNDVLLKSKAVGTGARRWPELGFQGVVLKHKDGAASWPTDINRGNLFNLYHEVDHLLRKNGLPGDKGYSEIKAENMADAHATLVCLQRLGCGPEVVSALQAWSTKRALDMLLRGDDWHVTTVVINQILEDSKTTDFTKLSPQKPFTVAQKYARDFGPSQFDIINATTTYKSMIPPNLSDIRERGMEKECVQFFKDKCLGSKNPFTLQLGIHVLPLLLAYPKLDRPEMFAGLTPQGTVYQKCTEAIQIYRAQGSFPQTIAQRSSRISRAHTPVHPQ